MMRFYQVTLLEAHFFPQWHAVLRHWLVNAPNFDEVTRWLTGWQVAFPGDLRDQQRIRTQFAAAKDALAQCMAGQPLPPMPHAEAPPTDTAPQAPPRPMAAATVDTSMRALVEQFAIENNVALVPKVWFCLLCHRVGLDPHRCRWDGAIWGCRCIRLETSAS